MSLRITQGPGVLTPEQFDERRFGGSGGGGDFSLSAMSATGNQNTNNTNIKPTSTPSAPSASGGMASLSNIGAPSLQQLSTGGAPESAQGTNNDPSVAAAATTSIAQSGLSAANGDYGDMTALSDSQLYDILLYGANAATEQERSSIAAAARAEQAARSGTFSAPTGNGMGANGGQAGVTQTQAPTSVAPTAPLQPAPGSVTPPAQGAGTTPAPGTGTPPASNGMGSSGGQVGAGQPPGGTSTGTVGANTGAPVGSGHNGSDPFLDPITGLPANANQGQGGTTFNPGGGTNPDGTNPTVPQGNTNNGTSPSVYQLTGQDGSGGGVANTTNADGSVQGTYQPDQGGAFQAISSDSAAMSDMDVATAAAAAAANNDRTITDDELSSNQLNDILSQDSPLMSLARQDGVNMANSVGLRNSSLAAGAQMAEMTRQATPLAQQQAEAYRQAAAQNQSLESARLEQNAGREQQTNLFNAESENAATSQEFQTEAARRDANAARQTQTSVSNAAFGNDMMNNDRQRELNYNMQQLAGDQDFAKQQLAAQTAVDVANVEGQYKQFISQNDTAARMFDSYYSVVQDVVGNAEFNQSEAIGRLNAAKQDFEAGMELILEFESFNLANPGAGSGPGTPNFNDIPDFGTPEWDAWIGNFNSGFQIP